MSVLGGHPAQCIVHAHHIPGHGGMSPTPRRFRYGDRKCSTQDGRQQRSGHHRARVSLEKGPARLCHLCQVEMPKCSSWRPCLRECQRPPSDTQPGQRKPGTPSAKLRMGSTPSYLHGLQKGSRHRASDSRAPKKGTGYAR